MPASAPTNLSSFTPRDLPPPANDGSWELHLWDGSVWFSDWFYRKLQWPAGDAPKTLVDLQPCLESDGWDALLRRIRAHLEQHTPLDTEICVRLPDGRTERWELRGTAERNARGQPVHLAGNVRQVMVSSAR